jgi:hypothetical protein
MAIFHNEAHSKIWKEYASQERKGKINVLEKAQTLSQNEDAKYENGDCKLTERSGR